MNYHQNMYGLQIGIVILMNVKQIKTVPKMTKKMKKIKKSIIQIVMDGFIVIVWKKILKNGVMYR